MFVKVRHRFNTHFIMNFCNRLSEFREMTIVFVCVILIQKRYEDNFDEEASEACLHGWLFGGGPE